MKNGTFLLLLNESRTKIFLVKRSDFPVWGLTGGGLLDGEDPQKGAVREAIEETGFDVKVVKNRGFFRNDHSVRHLYEGRKVGGKFIPEYPGCEGAWFDLDKLPIDILQLSLMMIKKVGETRSVRLDFNCHDYDMRDLQLIIRHPIRSVGYFYSKLLRRWFTKTM